MKILHLSDLHICAESVRCNIAILERHLKRLVPSIEFSSPTLEQLAGLESAVAKIDPDVICITGDVTTLGDKASFRDAASFIAKLKIRPNRAERQILAIPGNHDALFFRLFEAAHGRVSVPGFQSARRSRFGKLLRPIVLCVSVRFRSRLKKLLAKIEAPTPKSALHNFEQFQSEVGGDAVLVCEKDGAKVLIVAHDSTSRVSGLPNMGNVGAGAIAITGSVFSKHPTHLKLALLHHNPLSSPRVIEDAAHFFFNAMPSGSAVVKDLQDIGADGILFGHQHARNNCLIDFIPNEVGHVYLMGAASATMGSVEQAAGFNVLEVHDSNGASLEHYERSIHGGIFTKTGSLGLTFERSAVGDYLTSCVQREVRHYRAKADSEWEEMIKGGHDGLEDLLLVGPRQEDLENAAKTQELIDILRKGSLKSLRIVLADPALYEALEKSPKASKSILEHMWDRKGSASRFGWKDQSKTAKRVVESVRATISTLSQAEKEKVDLRLSGILMPIGARAKNIDRPHGAILVRLLPVGMFSDMDRPEMRLERRHDAALYNYYARYLGLLFDHATKVSL